MGIILEPFFYILAFVANLYFVIVVVEVALHWLMHFKIIEADNKYSQKLVEILKSVTEPVYAKIRAKVPPLGGVDVSPFIMIIVLLFVLRLFSNIMNYALQ